MFTPCLRTVPQFSETGTNNPDRDQNETVQRSLNHLILADIMRNPDTPAGRRSGTYLFVEIIRMRRSPQNRLNQDTDAHGNAVSTMQVEGLRGV